MDRWYLKGVLDGLEREKSEHARKFGDNPKHANCMPNFERIIEKMRAELARAEAAGPSEANL